MDFSTQVHTKAQNLWDKSFNHPFIKEMASGKLAIAKFRFYCIQDYKYLEHFNQLQHQVMPSLATKYGIPEDLFAVDDSKVEIVEREHYFKEMQVSDKQYQEARLAPTAYDYINHMQISVLKGPEIGLASLLPCPWLYCELAQHWENQTSPQKMYQRFFKTYQSISKNGEIKAMKQALDTVADQCDEQTKSQMTQAFMRSSYYELHFWQMGYDQESWSK